jgi:phosphomannomutase
MSNTTPTNPRIIALFDVDGTLTLPRGEVTPDMMAFMKDLSTKITVGIVGGSDLPKQEEQLGEGIAKVFPYNFSQNGLVAYKNGELLEVQTISKQLGEDNVKRIINWVMKYLADVDIPIKVCRNIYGRRRSYFMLRIKRLSLWVVSQSKFVSIYYLLLARNLL